MGVRRLIVLTAGLPVFLAVQIGHGICLLLDEVLFPGHRRVSLDGALIITGIPRSGTTFMHRTLAADTERYTTLTTWEALLAPSILQRRAIHGMGWLDRRIGCPLGRGLAALTRKLTGSLDDIHEVGLDAAEEDYLTLLPAGGCFVMLLAFPSALGLQRLGQLDRTMPAGRRRRLLRFYRGCLQRHIYADGGERRLLSKNAAFGSWLAGLYEIVPEARFIVCIRQPDQALSSQIGSVAAAQRLFGAQTDGAAFQTLFLDIYAGTLQHLAATIASWPQDRATIVDTAALRDEPAASIRETMGRLNQTETPSLTAALAALSGGGGSGHHHRVDALALDRGTMEQRMTPAYQQLLELPHCVTGVA